ncbi:Inosine-uridine preferring nucleoside hydrolase [Entamoeba marina]
MQKVIIDTDCGVDDAVAIFLAIASKKVDIVAITCVVGNTTLDNVLNNVGRVLEMAHREDIPIYAGANDNLLQIHMDRWRGHGGDGFGDVKDIPDTHLKPASNRHAALEIIDLVHKHEKQLDIITLGPLTNIAVALSLEPKLLELCGKVHMMFGSETCKGNICPLGEFNCAYDPDSAKNSI